MTANNRDMHSSPKQHHCDRCEDHSVLVCRYRGMSPNEGACLESASESFGRSLDIAGGLLALETENTQLKREVERLRVELVIAKSELAEASRVSKARIDALGVATDEMLRLREAKEKAWGLVDDVWLVAQLRGVGSGDYTDVLRKISTALAARKAGS